MAYGKRLNQACFFDILKSKKNKALPPKRLVKIIDKGIAKGIPKIHAFDHLKENILFKLRLTQAGPDWPRLGCAHWDRSGGLPRHPAEIFGAEISRRNSSAHDRTSGRALARCQTVIQAHRHRVLELWVPQILQLCQWHQSLRGKERLQARKVTNVTLQHSNRWGRYRAVFSAE